MSRARLDLDPTAIRLRLAALREEGMAFAPAWEQATGISELPERLDTDDRECFKFMRRHFEAAYCNNTSSKGRCFIPELDVSNALLMAQSESSGDHKRCRSGDGCDRPAVRGQFGKTWCEYHGAELDRIANTIQVFIDDPKLRGGGRAIMGTKGARAA